MTDASRNLRFGWWALLAFITMGLVLEAMHGFKIGAYLDASQETRRLMWTLSHAHGTLLAIVNIVFAITVDRFEVSGPRRIRAASRNLMVSGVLLPLGFFLGGLVTYAGDPGLGVLLVPIGALLLIAGVALTALGVNRPKQP